MTAQLPQDVAQYVVCGVPIGTIRSRLFRGRRLMQQQLGAHARDAGIRAAFSVPA